ncbi:MAG TPA: peptidyl-prolyl cis-trans isomerase [Pyrinomonadaceae bacterium]|nr:peptidyl-prolyl cis-trans isomerase [Pyrinomonadaceae bacterium]
MLKQLGRLERTRNIIILGFAVLMAVSLVIFYAPNRSATTINPATSTEVVAKVGSDKITVADLMLVRESFRQRYGSQIPIAQLGGNRSFLESLIAKHVIRQEAERLGLSASDAEVKERIMRQFSDASGVFVGSERYKESVIPRYGSVEKFENELRDEIAQEKLRAFITSSVNVSDDEVQQEYKRQETLFDISYAIVSADKLAEKIEPSDSELRSYYDSHKNELRYNEPQRKVRYIFVDQEKAASKLQISDEDLKAEYDKLAPEFKQAGVKAQQIVLKVARKDLDAQVEQKTKDLIAKLRGTTGKSTEQAFAEAARGNSEDPPTASAGGFLPNPVKKNPNKPHGLYDRVLDMQPGDVTDVPIRYGGNFYILRRGDSVPKTFEAAKQEILVSLRNRRSYSEALKVATKAYQRLKETKDIQKVAQEVASEANMTAATMIRETPYIKPGDDVKDIGTNQQFEAAVGQLNNPNDIAEPTGIKGGFAIPILVDKKEPRIPEFDEVKTQLANTVKKQRAKDELEQKARSLLSSVTSADGVKAAGEKEGFEADEKPNFKIGSPLGNLEASQMLDDTIFNMKAGELAKSPVKVGENWVVFGITKRKDADMAEFAKSRDDVRQQMLRERQSQVFEDYISGVQRRMKGEGSIKVYDDVLNSIEEAEEPSAVPGLPPGLNFPSK